MDGLEEHHAKWKKSDSERQTPYLFSHIQNPDLNLQMCACGRGHEKGQFLKEGRRERNKIHVT